MKFSFILKILCSYLVIYRPGLGECEEMNLNLNEQNRYLHDAEYRAFLEKECERLTIENTLVCEKFNKSKSESESNASLNMENTISFSISLYEGIILPLSVQLKTTQRL